MTPSLPGPTWLLPSLLTLCLTATAGTAAAQPAPESAPEEDHSLALNHPGESQPEEDHSLALGLPGETPQQEAPQNLSLNLPGDGPQQEAPQVLSLGLPGGVRISGYVQGQYESHEDSEDELDAAGNLLNQDRFVLRRARLKLTGDWTYAGAIFELNGSTTSGGFNVSVRRAEASLHYRPEGSSAPLLEGAIGVMDQPFGFELLQSSRQRLFMERALVVRSLFPSPADVGARLGGTLDWFHWTVAVMNGEPQSEKVGFPGGDPNGAKDILFRVGVDTAPAQRLRISGDVSLLKGTGFHAGSPATKERLEWRDLNEDGIAQTYEYTPVPGAAATSSANFDRWAVGADLQVAFDTSLGTTELMGEFIYGENLDRLNFPNDPVVTGLDAREFGYYIAIVQELGRHAIAGFRYDSYEPDSNVFDKRRGQLIPTSSRIETFSPVVGLVLQDRARLSLQYDIVRDHLARDTSGVPANLANNALTLRLQVQM